MMGFCAHGNKQSGSMKGRKLVKQLKNYEVLKKDITPRSVKCKE